jgi:UDP-N-acetyl-D-mannosaminuronic acid transferase (WecB/TagA/CpsF family)
MRQRDAELIKLEVIGQISIVEDRLAELKSHLMVAPMSEAWLSDQTDNLIGNVSLQVGALIGLLSDYGDSDVKRTPHSS